MSVQRVFRLRILEPLKVQLRQGVSPERLALAAALGIVLGITPLLGIGTPLCLAAGLLLGLNQPTIQAFNYLAYPIQIGMLVPFLKLGNRWFAAQPAPLRPDRIVELMRSDLGGALRTYGRVLLHAGLVWILVAPFAAVAIYLAARPLFRSLRSP